MRIEIWLAVVLILLFFATGTLLGYLVNRILRFYKGTKLLKSEMLVAQAQTEARSIIKNATMEASKQTLANQINIENTTKTAQKNAEKYLIEAQHQIQLEIKAKNQEFLTQSEHLKQRQTNLFKNEQELEVQNQQIFEKKITLDKLINSNKNLERTYQDKLVKVAKITPGKAKAEILDAIKKTATQEGEMFLRNHKAKLELNAKKLATEIMLQAMETYAAETVASSTTTIVEIPSDNIKGYIIGKDGRNIKALEKYAGVDIIVDESPGIVSVSSFDPIRREIAVQTLQKLIIDGRIQPVRIEDTINKTRVELEKIIYETGQQVVADLDLIPTSQRLIKLIGRLKYRTSFNQNVLNHSIEVAKIASKIAHELNLDGKIAMRAGLLHDIGKAVDFEAEGSHVTLGTQIALENKEDPIVVNAIASHHGDEPADNPYSFIVAVADTLSAARPGARFNHLENFLERMKELEEICQSVPGVQTAYVLQSGRRIQVMVDPVKTDDIQCNIIAQEIKNKIKKQKKVPGDIIVTVIREVRRTAKII